MMRFFYFGILSLSFCSTTFAEDHKKAVLSLSNGKYVETFDQDSIEVIGNILYNVNSRSIVGFVEENVDTANTMKPEIISRWLSIDPLAAKYPSMSPYAFCNNNPIVLVDVDGREPTRAQAGTASGFVAFLNNTRSKMGTLVGASAHNAMLRLGKTEFNWSHMRPEPTTTNPFNTSSDKYIYTEKGGWLDMSHFMFYAGRAYDYKQQKSEAQKKIKEPGGGSPGAISRANMDPVGEAVQDGYHQEMSDGFVARHSAYSYEDLPSDKLGADFGANFFDPNSKLSLGEQLQSYLTNLNATTPENAPNYESMPATDADLGKTPSRTNESTKPVYTKQNP